MSPRRIVFSALFVLSACHVPPAAAPTRAGGTPGTTGTRGTTLTPPTAPPKTVPRFDDDDLFEKAAEDDDGLDAELASLAARAKTPTDRASVPGPRWDRKTPPKNLDRIIEHLGMTADERKKLEANGFVALARQEHRSYGTAFHRVHQEELPLYVSADAILHALFRSHEAIMMEAENDASNALGEILEKMRAELPKAASAYPAEVARDADLYLAVAERLLRQNAPPPTLAAASEVDALVQKVHDAKGVEAITIFGRPRLVDFSFYTPRGPYPRAGLSDYFQAMVWLTRLEMNLVSRGGRSSAPALDPNETPREATLALALTDLAKRSGTMADVAKLERLYGALSGSSEAISPMDLERLGQGIALGDPDAAAKQLRAAIGNGFKRTTNYHVRPFFTPELPAIATFLGVGITPDAPLVTSLMVRGSPRVVRGPEVAFALGVDRARAYVGADAQPLLPLARAELGKRTGPDLYAAWLAAVRGLAKTPKGTLPGFAESTAFADSRVGSMMIGYGQIRHAYALHGVQVYDEGGCKIPDAYVDPAIDVYEGMLAYGKQLRGMRGLFSSPARIDAYADAVDLHVGALLAIAKDELAGRPLTSEQKDYLALIAEHERPSRYAMRRPPRFNGWYGRLFAGGDAFDPVPFVADYATSPFNKTISYVGAREPVLAVFVVDVGGEPRAMVGPVGRAMEKVRPLAKRLTDDDMQDDSWAFEGAPGAWEKTWLAPAVREPKMSVQNTNASSASILPEEPFDVVVEYVDEHADTIARSAKVHLKPGEDATTIPLVAIEGKSAKEHRDTRIRFGDGSVWRGWSNR